MSNLRIEQNTAFSAANATIGILNLQDDSIGIAKYTDIIEGGDTLTYGNESVPAPRVGVFRVIRNYAEGDGAITIAGVDIRSDNDLVFFSKGNGGQGNELELAVASVSASGRSFNVVAATPGNISGDDPEFLWHIVHVNTVDTSGSIA